MVGLVLCSVCSFSSTLGLSFALLGDFEEDEDLWLSNRLIKLVSSSKDCLRLAPKLEKDSCFFKASLASFMGLDHGTLELLQPSVLQNKILPLKANI